jgi:Bacterial Ig-like domain (group 2)
MEMRISHSRLRRLMLVVGGGLSPIACESSNSSPTPDRCFIIVAEIAPPAPVVTVGESLQLTATYNAVSPDCLPDVPASALHWQSSNAGIATVDSTQGLLTGHRAGRTEVTVHAPGSAAVLGSTEAQVSGP